VKLPDPCSLRGAATSDGLRVTGSEGLQRSDPHSVRFVPLQSDAMLLLAGVPYRGSFELRADAAQLTLIKGCWLRALLARARKNTVVVALANKLARIVWAVLARRDCYQTATG